MEKYAREQDQPGPLPYRPSAGASAFTEPEVRRWPPPVEGTPPAENLSQKPPGDGMLHYIRCALSYQNQTLADIKALLEQIAANMAEK